MELTKAIEHAYDGNAILFLGSGFSIGGQNLVGTGMKTGKELSWAICDDLKIGRSDNLAISSDRYLNDEQCKKSLAEFIEFLKGECTCDIVSKTQETVVELPWHRIYTTNYDNIVEIASQRKNVKRKSITITNKRYKVGQNLEQAIVHINGYIGNIDEKSFYDEFKITDESYTRNGLLESPWGELFESDLKSVRAVVFVGYSLQYDQDIVKCIARLKIKDKCVFVDVPEISSDAVYLFNRYGELFLKGADGFAEEIREVGANYTPRKRILELQGFEERTESDYYSEKTHSSNDVFQLLAMGSLNRHYISQPNYCVQRKKTMELVEAEIPKRKLIIIQSYLGNGKTVFLECLAKALLEQYRVYFLKNLDAFHEDMNLIQSVGAKEAILFIDDGDRYRPLFREFGKTFPEGIKIVTACRTAINSHWFHSLVEEYGFLEEDIYIHDIDIMETDDVNELCTVLNKNYLWGQFETLSLTQKKKKISKDYKKKLSNVFYMLLESKAIEDEVARVMESLTLKLKLRDFVLAQTINMLCQLKFSYDDICKFTKVSNNDLINFAKDDAVQEIIDFQQSEFLIRSSVFLKYLVKESVFEGDIVNMLTMLFRNCSIGDKDRKRYESQRRSMVSRSDILMVMSEKDEPTEKNERQMFQYYDSIKEMPTAKENPFFWLQFAITTLNLGEFGLAKIYFNNAYANASVISDFNTYQIDTHYARLLLAREIKTNRNNKERAMENFYKAHELLYKNSRMGKLDYALRQTGIYTEYFRTYQSMMSDQEQGEFLQAAAQFIDLYKDYFRENPVKGIYHINQAYKQYREVFFNTEYQILLKECNQLFRDRT